MVWRLSDVSHDDDIDTLENNENIIISRIIENRKSKLDLALQIFNKHAFNSNSWNWNYVSTSDAGIDEALQKQKAFVQNLIKLVKSCSSDSVRKQLNDPIFADQFTFKLYHGLVFGTLRKCDIEKLCSSKIQDVDFDNIRSIAFEMKLYGYVQEDKKPYSLDLPQDFLELSSDVPQLRSGESDTPDNDFSVSDSFAQQKDDSNNHFDAKWLKDSCGSFSHIMPPSDLAAHIIQVLKSSTAPDEQLLDLLGFTDTSLEFIGTIIANKNQLIQPPKATANPPSMEYPVFAPASRETGGVLQTVKIESTNSGKKVALPTAPGARPAGTTEVRCKHKRITGPGSMPGKDGEPPDEGEYVKVHIPPLIPRHAEQSKLVPISAFGSFGQVAFEGVKKLNRLQSAVFTVAYHTNHNMLVCAPTGAGKTNVAMTTVVRELERNANNVLATKIIYVAPMKALAQEVVDKFSARLSKLGITVRELTGDMQLTKTEIENTQLIVTTPEKWDVITRKTGDGTLVEAVGLLIIDEVHLVGEDRGPVIESLVARTLRLVEQKQKMVRIVGLSATLPNYKDVAHFLRVDPDCGLFFFDNSYRPVPLEQTFIGVIEKNVQKRLAMYNDIAFEQAVDSIRRGHQVMVFVHSRKDTAKTARAFMEAAQRTNLEDVFLLPTMPTRGKFEAFVAQSRNAELRQLFASGIGIHHAGMLRADRSNTEKMFNNQAISILFCTATLAWGVNLPVHTVIIKGTQIYVPEKGGLVELNMQDVMQCFGRAGRPQFDTSGEAILITEQEQMTRYLSLLNNALPLESHLHKFLPDALNAEIASGTVTNLHEAVEWLSYTFLHIRMMLNPVKYGITFKEKETDPTLAKRRADMIISAAKQLDTSRMSRFAKQNIQMDSPFGVTDLGRIASHYYIGYETIDTFNQKLQQYMTDEQVVDLLCHASEFANLRVREEELSELSKLRKNGCAMEVLSPIDSPRGKSAVLFQSYITGAYISSFTLSSDMNYIAQNMGRVARAVFEMCLNKRWCCMAQQLLSICIALEKRCWWHPYGHPLRQFSTLAADVVKKLETLGERTWLENLLEMSPRDIGTLLNLPRIGDRVASCARRIPYLHIETYTQPLTRSLLRVQLDIAVDFEWAERVHGKAQGFWIWITDQSSEWIYHSERLLVRHDKSKIRREVTVPLFDPIAAEYYLIVYSDNWLGSENVIPLPLHNLVLPETEHQYSELLTLRPLPRSALKNASYELLYADRFEHFNPMQSQTYHVLYHTDYNTLIAAPKGSGKTVCSELAMLRMFGRQPTSKVLFLSPLMSLAVEQARAWQSSIGSTLGKRIVECVRDPTPDRGFLENADVITTTPEFWERIWRLPRFQKLMEQVGLLIIDEIHLMGEERGSLLEILVARFRRCYPSVRIVALSTTLAMPADMANWLGVDQVGCYNFRPQARHVPLEAHISGFPGYQYAPRMASMNKPAFQAILTHGTSKPVLLFVSSKRQAKLTAMDLISYCGASDHPRQFLHEDYEIMAAISLQAKDETLRHTLAFGIALHHSSLQKSDRELVEHLFVSGKVQVLICTSEITWGGMWPAGLVIIKGTEQFDARTRRYQPMPVSDVLQMMGRAGRPQTDSNAVAMIFVEESLKEYYKKFLCEPLPVESQLPKIIINCFNGEIASGEVRCEKTALNYLSWTYFFRRISMNPSYYGVESEHAVDEFALELIRNAFKSLEEHGCCKVDKKGNIKPTRFGIIGARYYLDYHTVSKFISANAPTLDVKEIVSILAGAHEFKSIPMRYKEDIVNSEFADGLPWKLNGLDPNSSRAKVFLLLQAHCKRLRTPTKDYSMDLTAVLSKIDRIIGGYCEVCTHVDPLIMGILVYRSIVEGKWFQEVLPTFSKISPKSMSDPGLLEFEIPSKVKADRQETSLAWWVIWSNDLMGKVLQVKRYKSLRQIENVIQGASVIYIMHAHVQSLNYVYEFPKSM